VATKVSLALLRVESPSWRHGLWSAPISCRQSSF
jgi:hypothetical protein